jgi:hypothetical protein
MLTSDELLARSENGSRHMPGDVSAAHVSGDRPLCTASGSPSVRLLLAWLVLSPPGNEFR